MESIIENDDRLEQSLVVPADNSSDADNEFKSYTQGEENLNDSKDNIEECNMKIRNKML